MVAKYSAKKNKKRLDKIKKSCYNIDTIKKERGNFMNTELIYKYCEVIADRTNAEGARAIFFVEDGYGYVATNVRDEGEYLAFSCNSEEEFEEICESLAIS